MSLAQPIYKERLDHSCPALAYSTFPAWSEPADAVHRDLQQMSLARQHFALPCKRVPIKDRSAAAALCMRVCSEPRGSHWRICYAASDRGGTRESSRSHQAEEQRHHFVDAWWPQSHRHVGSEALMLPKNFAASSARSIARSPAFN